MDQPTADPESCRKSSVLIAPHCTECGETIRTLLSLVGFAPEVVPGHAIVRRALEVLPQAVLVDLNLPGEDSFEVGRRLRAGLGSAVRLIGLTPSGWEGDPADWTEAGFDGWLRKPVHPSQLLDLLANARRAR
jgi:DNA-binding response OmpR family regulator